MTAPSSFVRGFGTAYKRARSHDSSTPLASPPVLKATKIEEGEEATEDDTEVPAFLRQSQAAIRTKFNDLAWKEKLRVLQGRNDPNSQWVQVTNPQTVKRNRYANIQPWDKSRVHLKVAQGKSDYINASPISLRDPRTGRETNYIATQGPKQLSTSHFWHMVWQETNDVAVIVMLTQTHDGAMEKCCQYFPLDAEAGPYKIESLDPAGDLPEGSVTFLDMTSHPHSKTEVRKLSLQFGEKVKDVWHFLFTGWPDFAVPEDQDRAALLNLLKLSAEKNSTSSNPRIVHCSAGVGRTGTFVALEYLLAQVESGAIADTKDGTDLVYEVVNRLREQRVSMVQMDIQFQFLYDVVKEQYRQKLANLHPSGQQSPKLQRLASGLRAALIEEVRNEDGFFDARTTAGFNGKGSGRATPDDRQAEGTANKGITPFWDWAGRPVSISLGGIIAIAAGVAGAFMWSVTK